MRYVLKKKNRLEKKIEDQVLTQIQINVCSRLHTYLTDLFEIILASITILKKETNSSYKLGEKCYIIWITDDCEWDWNMIMMDDIGIDKYLA